jgi:hypothetical protein
LWRLLQLRQQVLIHARNGPHASRRSSSRKPVAIALGPRGSDRTMLGGILRMYAIQWFERRSFFLICGLQGNAFSSGQTGQYIGFHFPKEYFEALSLLLFGLFLNGPNLSRLRI